MKSADQTLKLKQGEDTILELPITDDAGNPVDLSTATEIRAFVLVNNVLQAKYSLANLSGYGTILVGGTGNNTVRVLVTGTASKNFTLGSFKAAVRITMPQADLGSEKTEVEVALGNILAGYLKDES